MKRPKKGTVVLVKMPDGKEHRGVIVHHGRNMYGIYARIRFDNYAENGEEVLDVHPSSVRVLEAK